MAAQPSTPGDSDRLPPACSVLVAVRGDVVRGSDTAPLWCARSVIDRVLSPLLSASWRPCVLMAPFARCLNQTSLRGNLTHTSETCESVDVRRAVRDLYSSLVPTDQVVVPRQRLQAASLVGSMDASMGHPFARAAQGALLLRFDLFLKVSLGPLFLPLLGKRPGSPPQVLMTFPVHDLLSPKRPVGGRGGCMHFCAWRPRDAYPPDRKRNCYSPACSRCGAYTGEPPCLSNRTTELSLVANDVLFGFFPAPIKVWGGLRAAFVAEGGSLHGVGERLRPPACVSYLTQDDFDANTELGANPIYELASPSRHPRSYARLQNGSCMRAEEFVRCGAFGPLRCPPCGAAHRIEIPGRPTKVTPRVPLCATANAATRRQSRFRL